MSDLPPSIPPSSSDSDGGGNDELFPKVGAIKKDSHDESGNLVIDPSIELYCPKYSIGQGRTLFECLSSVNWYFPSISLKTGAIFCFILYFFSNE